MLSQKVKNKHVIEMHKGKPHIRTEVSFMTPIKEEDLNKFNALLLHQELDKTLKDMVAKVEEEIGDTFECDVESIYVGLKNTL
ncbi:hypothetical protein [Guptibacillus spartinae]|uniref:hypothetical protein n=1 Tax=Guptibacillus spartinae TaxID=3025679 RepID=UPI00235E0BCC|nr:hypothetical protein [Pseudalkalibacillus spartinae]